jgi:hypothetical protein
MTVMTVDQPPIGHAAGTRFTASSIASWRPGTATWPSLVALSPSPRAAIVLRLMDGQAHAAPDHA